MSFVQVLKAAHAALGGGYARAGADGEVRVLLSRMCSLSMRIVFS